MIINLGNFSYEICPRYPALPGGSATWLTLTDKYERYGRQASGVAGQEPIGESEITIVDGRMQMSAPLGPILPLDDNTLIILSGSFAIETITRDPDSSMLYHQNHVYRPI